MEDIETLAAKSCKVCGSSGTPDLIDPQKLPKLLAALPLWQVVEGKKLQREFVFKRYLDSVEWIGRIAQIAEAERHHPDLHVFWRRIVVEVWTHSAGGLTENDFILAAKIERG